ncbi:MAG: geranylgeranylglycerol-phosphate geranylgeranyltransferase [bacterium]
MRKKLLAFLTITRPANAAITALSVFIAGLISNHEWRQHGGVLLLAAVSAGCIAAGGNIYNDFCDRKLDQAQKPHRPLPAGTITPKSALGWGIANFAVGNLFAIMLGWKMVFIAIAATVLLILYSRYWKGMPLIGNVAVASTAALAFIYGGIAVEGYAAALWAAELAFLYHLSREIIKDMEDFPGDALHHANTLIVKYGLNAGRWAASLTLLLLAILLPLPHVLGDFRSAYLWIALLGVLPILIVAVYLLWRWTSSAQFQRLSAVLKYNMLVGLLALYCGRPGTTLG